MWSAVHGPVGAAIFIAAPNPAVGAVGAFVSHFLLDYIQEGSPFKNRVKDSALEFIFLGIFMAAAYRAEIFWPAMAGWVFGMLPDLIDKPLTWFFGRKSYFSCHNGLGFLRIGAWRFGYPTIVTLTGGQTAFLHVAVCWFWVVYASLV